MAVTKKGAAARSENNVTVVTQERELVRIRHTKSTMDDSIPVAAMRAIDQEVGAADLPDDGPLRFRFEVHGVEFVIEADRKEG